MKKVMCVVCLMLVVGVLVCGGASKVKQKLTEQEQETKLEAFKNQTGTVIITGRSDIGTVYATGSVKVVCIEIKDVKSEQRQMGIFIEVKKSEGYESEDQAFVDYDEIESLLGGIDYVSKVEARATKLSRFEAGYKTSGELRIVTFGPASGNIEVAVSAGSFGSTSAFMSKAKLSELRTIIAKAKQKLDEIK